jgi:hypothetical protein
MMNWHHSGFNVYCGDAIWPHNEEGSASDSSDGVAKVVYASKDGKTSKTFDALDWLAQLVTHIPDRGEQMVRYYGFYSNKSRGMRIKAGKDDEVPALIDSDISRKAFRINWVRNIDQLHPIQRVCQ